MGLDSALWLIISVAQLAVIGLLLYRRVWHSFPIFLLYGVWTLLSNAALYFIFRHYGMRSPAYATGYLAEFAIDSLIQFGVLLELGWSILRPLRPAPPRTALIPVAALILILGAIIWPLASFSGESALSRNGAVIRHLQQTFSILRVVVLVGLAAFSQSLSLGWRNRELQIATGLGFNSLVALIVTMLHAYPSLGPQYFRLGELVVVSYLGSLLYWIVSFAQKEQERRAFSPQVQSVLLAVAGAARSTRMSLEETGAGRKTPR